MSKISDRLLNKTVVVKNYTQTEDINGDLSNTEIIIDSAMKMRITRNNTDKSEFSGTESGKFITSTHVGFCDSDKDVKVGYIILDGINKYSVDAVDPIPGGVIDHHLEIGITLVEPEQVDI